MADAWFAVEPQPSGVLRIWEPHVSRLLRANMFLIRGRERDLLVDAGMGVASLRGFLESLLDKPVTLLLTHGHVDHVGSAAEFAGDILMHPAEAPGLAAPSPDWTISCEACPKDKKARLRATGFDTTGLAIAALPQPGYDPAQWRIAPAQATRLVDEGDLVDLGDRVFEVLHLPGHSPGSIGLWDSAAGLLIGGDALYDGLLIDTLPDSDPAAYRRTMARLRALSPAIVHGGHRESFGPAKYAALIDDYLSGA